MHKRAVSLGLSVMMGMTILIAPVQAAGFPFLQPYVSDYKIGFTDGSKRVTQPLYETFSKEKEVLVVTKNDKKGVLHAKTGTEIIPAVWDSIEVPDRCLIGMEASCYSPYTHRFPFCKMAMFNFAGRRALVY